MKKLFMALMAVAAIAFTSCVGGGKKTFKYANNYEKPVMFMISADQQGANIEEAECVVCLEPGKTYMNQFKSVKGLYVVCFIATSEEVEKDENGMKVYTSYKYKYTFDLDEYKNFSLFELYFGENGLPGIEVN